MDILERFRSKFEIMPSGCWLWRSKSINQDGYGMFCIGVGRVVPAHRFSYEVHVGPIPRGHHVCHTCTANGCVNPAHLETRPGNRRQFPDVRYPVIKERRRAENMLRWLAEKFPPWAETIEDMRGDLAGYGHRKKGWRTADFAAAQEHVR